MSTFSVHFYEYGNKLIYPDIFSTYEEACKYVKYFVNEELGVTYNWSGKKGTVCHITEEFNIKIVENKG
jgi:hypothetical protein